MSAQPKTDRELPKRLPGFEHIAQSWDATQNVAAAKILPGEYYVTINNEMITTVLGSCVSACIRDLDTGVGGMNHFMLPGDSSRDNDKWGGTDCPTTRFGVAAMEDLINDILKHGRSKGRLEVKLFGGGEILNMETSNVGAKNVSFVRDFVRAENLNVVAEDLGGPYPRKINFFPKTGKVLMRRLRAVHKSTIADQEKRYATVLKKPRSTGVMDSS